MVDLTAVAAFTAAGLSAVSVLISIQAQGRSERYRWRRETLPDLMQRALLWSTHHSTLCQFVWMEVQAAAAMRGAGQEGNVSEGGEAIILTRDWL